MGQALQGKEVLHQHPGFGQLGHPHRQAHGDEEHQPLGEHPQQTGGGGGHRVEEGRAPPEVRLHKEQRPQGRDEKGGEPGHLPHGGHQLRVIRRGGFGLLGEAGGVVVRSHPHHPGHAGPGDHRAAREQLVTRPLPHRGGLPGEQRLVGLHPALQHQGVRRDLRPPLQDDHVPQNQLLHRQRPGLAVPQGAGLGDGEDGDPLHQALGVELLGDADEGVQGDDEDEQQVGPGPHRRQGQGDEDVEQIEQGAYMLPDDLAGGLGDGGWRGVAASRLPQPPDLRFGQAVNG